MFNFSSGSITAFSSDAVRIWTGLQTDWADMTSGFTWYQWTSSIAAVFGEIGEANATSVLAIHSTLEDCSRTTATTPGNPAIGALCVEQ